MPVQNDGRFHSGRLWRRSAAAALLSMTAAICSTGLLAPTAALAVPPDSCPVKALVGKQAYSVCRSDDFWHVVGVSYYCIPGDGIQTQRDFDKKTVEKCKFKGRQIRTGASLAELMLQIITSALQPLDESCQAPTPVGEITVNECVADFWERATYLEYQCIRPEGETRLARPAKSRTRTSIPCTEKPPPIILGAPKDEDEDDTD
jgi:hypothetical protein